MAPVIRFGTASASGSPSTSRCRCWARVALLGGSRRGAPCPSGHVRAGAVKRAFSRPRCPFHQRARRRARVRVRDTRRPQGRRPHRRVGRSPAPGLPEARPGGARSSISTAAPRARSTRRLKLMLDRRAMPRSRSRSFLGNMLSATGCALPLVLRPGRVGTAGERPDNGPWTHASRPASDHGLGSEGYTEFFAETRSPVAGRIWTNFGSISGPGGSKCRIRRI